MVVHICNPSNWEAGRQEDDKFKACLKFKFETGYAVRPCLKKKKKQKQKREREEGREGGRKLV
jgi:hypothetical protein